MNLRDMRYLVAVADLRHFGKAAEQCHVSQPTLSGQIKKLEEQLGVMLFERTNRRVMLTETGAEIVTAARRMLREADTIEDIANNAHDPLSGRFRLGAFPTLSTYIFPQIAPKIKANLPNLRLMLIEDKTAQLLEKLKNGELDAAFIALPIDDDALDTAELFDDAFFLAVPPEHALANCKAVSQSVLSHYRLLLLDEGHCLRDQALEVCQLHGSAEEQDFRATGLETLRQMVKIGAGITFMPEIAIYKGESGIIYIPFKDPAPRRTIGLVWRKTTARLAAIDALIKACTP
jgi:LysR family hydrogen peroxide-inducible transcriptional activator